MRKGYTKKHLLQILKAYSEIMVDEHTKLNTKLLDAFEKELTALEKED